MKCRKWESEEVTGNQVIRLSPKDKPTGQAGNQAKGETENPDTPIHRYSDTPIRYKAGVTLVELLVAVALLSLIMVAFYTVFKIGTKAYQTGEKRVEIIQNARVAFDMMISQIRQALPDVNGDTPDVVFELGEGGTAREGRWITFYAPIDGVEGAERIQFSRYTGEPGTGDETNTLYKRVLNPPYQTSEGSYSLRSAGSQPLTAAMPGTEGIVYYLWFEDRPPANRIGMIKITMKFKADPTDVNEPETTLHAMVKAGIRYGEDITGGF
jgi:prepilin-type N-terminal cleavage/methylation domain-containing protein